MNYLQLVAATAMITIRQGMDDIPELQYVGEYTLEDALVKAAEANQGWCDDRWMIFGIDDQELDQLVDEEGNIVAFMINHSTPYTPLKFAMPGEEEITKFYADFPF